MLSEPIMKTFESSLMSIVSGTEDKLDTLILREEETLILRELQPEGKARLEAEGPKALVVANRLSMQIWPSLLWDETESLGL